MQSSSDNFAAEVLRAELAKKYCLRESILTQKGFGGLKDLRFYSVKSIDDILDQATDEDSIPFWAEIWDSALALVEYLGENTVDSGASRSMLELGCGVGVVGISAASLGYEVLQVDYSKEALLFAKLNSVLNRVSGVRQVYGDIRNLDINGEFDLITGADILYEPKLHPYILNVLDRYLRQGGYAYFSDPGRAWASNFIDLAVSRGWVWSIDEVGVNGRAAFKIIDILTLRRGDQK